MSHFTVMVVTNTGTREAIEDLLAPYNENLEVGFQEDLGFEKYYEEYGEDLSREEFAEEEGYICVDGRYGNKVNPKSKWDWYQVGGRWENSLISKDGKACDSLQVKDLDIDAINKNKRIESEEYWEESLKRDEAFRYSVYGINKDTTKEQYVSSSKFTMFAILDSSNWYEKGEMGWWACVSNENPDWQDFFDDYLNKLSKDKYITIVDCHI